ncbi:hypothetical protein V2J09_007768 [Rumex salicifolius]
MNCFPCFNRNKDSGGSSGVNEQPPAASLPDFSTESWQWQQKTSGKSVYLVKVVAVKQLDRNGMQGNKEFGTEVMALSLLKHQNLVNLIGYCADGDQRVLVYEYMPLRSVEDQLFGDGPEKKSLDWSTRMKIACGAAQGLEYLHEQINPSVIYGDFKPSNVLLNEEFEPKLSDVGLSKLGSDGMNQPSSRVMDTFGYSAPEYTRGGEITLKSDVYCFGIFPATALNQAVGIAAMCLQDEPMVRPLISDVTSVLNCISMKPNDQPQASAPPKQQMEYENGVQENISTDQDKSSSESHTTSNSESEDSECESDEHSTQSSQVSGGETESGSNEEESDDLSDEESTCNSEEESSASDSVKARTEQMSRRKSKKDSSKTWSQRKQGTTRQTVVTFRMPSMDSLRTSSSEDGSSDSEPNQQNGSRETGSSSSHPERPKQRGAIKSIAPLENRGHFTRSHTEPAQLRNLEIMNA